MELNLLPILNCEGKRLSIDAALQLDLHPEDTFCLLEPIEVKGQLVNIGGSLELDAEGRAKLTLTCDRCAESFEAEIPFQIQERFKKEDHTGEEETNPDITILEGTTIHLEELVYDALVLSMPSKVLCKEDCKGICPACGQNLNQNACDCDDRPTDPRFDILDKLL